MTVKMTCGPCGETITAADADELVSTVTLHAKQDHGITLTRDQVLSSMQPA